MKARRKLRVLATRGFERDLERIERFLESTGHAAGLDTLLDDLEGRVIPLLERTPRIGPPLQTLKLAADARLLLERVQSRLGANEARTLVRPDFVVLYVLGERVVHLVSVRHHRESGFKFGA